jgi:hypothetical protein
VARFDLTSRASRTKRLLRRWTRAASALPTLAATLALVHGATAQGAPGQPPPGAERPYRAELQAAQEAENARNEALAREHLLRALELLHGHPDVVYLLAQAEARLGHPEAAVGRLHTIAAMGVSYPADEDTAFRSLRSRPDFRSVLAALATNHTPVSRATPAYTLPAGDSNALAEDLAYDSRGHRFFVSSIHDRKILAIPEHGPTTEFVSSGRDGIFGVEALALDPVRQVLWATTAAVPQARGYLAADSGRSAVLCYDLGTGRLLHRYDVPRDGVHHDLGDMAVDPAGNVIVSDGTGGAVYSVPIGRDTLETVVPRGTFRSPQTPAVLPDGRLLIADYAFGLGIIDRRTRTVTWVAHADTMALAGIDGMVLLDHSLYAVQNGTRPERVVRFDLDSTFASVTGWSVIERATADLGEPTHAVIVGHTLYLLANSGWDRFNDDGSLKPGKATPPAIERIPIR